MKLLKSADDYFEIGNSYLIQKNFQKAHENFVKASEKYTRNGNRGNAGYSYTLALLMGLYGNSQNSDLYVRIKNVLESIPGPDIKFGLRTIPISDLIDECQLTSDEILALQFFHKDPSQYNISSAERVRDLANEYQHRIGERNLYIVEMFEDRQINGLEKSYYLNAVSEEMLAEITVWSNPKDSVKHYQMASYWRNILGHKDRDLLNNEKIKDYSKGVRCWFCDREVYGKEVHFFPMMTEISKYQENNEKQSIHNTFDLAQSRIYACRACYFALYYKIEEISQVYHQKTIEEIERVKSELTQQIRVLSQEIRQLK